ncbi:MAG: DUF3943 domain-containing protein [Syntrophales bacterium]|jgi:hypothetical protein|nr:DUF3943 domain-containing protein [Syntrophales bacterium]
MNQLLHPYQGSIYYGLARSAGLSFWESSAYTFAGSFLWETAGETTSLLIALGAGALAYQGITYTSREKIIDIGPIHATYDTKKTIPLPPILGGVALAGGIVLVLMGIRGKE